MKNSQKFLSVSLFALLIFVLQACSFSTANMSSLKVSKDKAATAEASSFKTGDTLYGQAEVSNNPGTVKVKYALVAEDAKGLTKGETLKGSDVSVDIKGDGAAEYNLPITQGVPAGTYKLNADMINEQGEKKDSKSANVTIVAGAAAEAAPVE